MHRILAKDTLEKYMKNNIITRWGEVTSGPNGVVTHRDVPTFIEGFIEIPPLLYMLQLRHTKTRPFFLDKINSGKASEKIYELVSHFHLEKIYPMKLNSNTKLHEFFIPGNIDDKSLNEHLESAKSRRFE